MKTPLSPAITARFTVLSRGAEPADALPPVIHLKGDLGFQLRLYYPAYIRHLGDAGARHYFIVPGFERLPPVVPAKCLSRSQRAMLLRLRKRSRKPAYCIVVTGRGAVADVRCQLFADIPGSRFLEATDLSTVPVGDLMPDGVATVKLTYRDRETLDVPVRDNFFSFTPPQPAVRRALRIIDHDLHRLADRHLGASRRRRLIRSIVAAMTRPAPKLAEWLDANGRRLHTTIVKPSGPISIILPQSPPK